MEGKPCVPPQREKWWSCLGSWCLSTGMVTFPSHMEALHARKASSPWLWDGQERKVRPGHVLNVHPLHWHQPLHTTDPHLPSKSTSCRLRVWLEKLCFAFKPLILTLFLKLPAELEDKDRASLRDVVLSQQLLCPAAPLFWKHLGSEPSGKSLQGTKAASKQCYRSYSCPVCFLCLPSLALEMFSNFQRTNKQNPGGSL